MGELRCGRVAEWGFVVWGICGVGESQCRGVAVCESCNVGESLIGKALAGSSVASVFPVRRESKQEKQGGHDTRQL